MSGIDLMQALFSKSNNDLWIVEDDSERRPTN